MQRLAILMICLLPGLVAGAEKKYAVLVGVNDYQHENLPALKYAERDVVELAKVLEDAGYSVTALVSSAKQDDHKPTKANIDKQLKSILKASKKGDTVLIALSGHGLQFDEQKDAYFCPLDARPFKDETKTLISLGELYQDMEKSFAGMKVLLVDACRNDPGAHGRSGVNGDNAPRPPQGVAALFSCKAGERAFENDKLQHGVFFYHVLQGLRGKAAVDGEITFANLASYVSRRVPKDVNERIGGEARQSPNLKADYTIEPILVGLKGTGAASKKDDIGKVEPKIGMADGSGDRAMAKTSDGKTARFKDGFVMLLNNDGKEIWRRTVDKSEPFHEMCMAGGDLCYVAGPKVHLLSVKTGQEIWNNSVPVGLAKLAPVSVSSNGKEIEVVYKTTGLTVVKFDAKTGRLVGTTERPQ